jgi:serine/threonine protein kinase
MRVAEGLLAMHRHGYIHADIKPNNILLTDGGLKIIDFGQSCPIGHTKERIQGTPDYIAPEQVALAPLDQRTDIFNLGATMYWVLTGKAFSTILPSAPAGSKKIELDARRGNEPPHETNPQVPLPLSRLIMDCCASARDERPEDMSKVISRLETILLLMAKKQSPATPTQSQG